MVKTNINNNVNNTYSSTEKTNMRANQAAVQRRVNNANTGRNIQTPINTQPPYPQQQMYGVGQPAGPPVASYNPYVPPQSQQALSPQPTYGGPPPNPTATPSATSPAMPPNLNPPQQLQFILNVMGERITKLEKDFKTLPNKGLSEQPQQAALENHPEFLKLKDQMSAINLAAESNDGDNKKIAELSEDVGNIFRMVESGDIADKARAQMQEEINTRTEILATEIHNIKDTVLQLQNTVINVILPYVVNPQHLSSTSLPSDHFEPQTTANTNDTDANDNGVDQDLHIPEGLEFPMEHLTF